MTTTERPNAASRSPCSPTPRRVHASSPTPAPRARRYNYFKPAKRKQTHYEDVTVDVQPDPRHYLSQGWIYGFADGEPRLPAALDEAQGVGRRRARAAARPRQRRHARRRTGPPTAGTSSATPTRSGSMTIYRYNANVVRQVNQNIENARNAKAFDQWTTNWVHFVERNVGAWMHIEHILGLYVFAAVQPLRPDEHAQHRAWRSTARTRSASRRTSRCTTSPSARRSRASTARRTSTRGTTTPSGRAPARSPRR